jgi:predicted phage terminase large subunit-like protein
MADDKTVEAALLLEKRLNIRRDLAAWCRHCGFEPAAHHILLLEKLAALTNGTGSDRVAVFMPPGAAKSTYASVLFPPWYLAQHPGHSVIAASHTAELAERWGRRVRNLIADPENAPILGFGLSADSQAAGRWETDKSGEYGAFGVGGSVTGRRADLIVIDDPVRSREDAESELIRDKTWEWYRSDLTTRLKPGGRVVLIQCMTGDTPVLMETGREKPLRDIRPGDRVATYENGKVSASTVRNWANQGPDRVFAIRMKSGITVKANARHPFLVEEGGETKWRRTATLKRGSVILGVTGASGAVSRALRRGVRSQQDAKVCATRTITSIGGAPAFDRLQSILSQGVKRICAIATELASQSMSAFWANRAEFALSANCPPLKLTPALTGTANSASITATTAIGSGAYSATIATLRLATARLSKFFSPPLSMCVIARDSVVEIVDAGIEDVFDIEVERTENFIANGLVSHNTRWHEDDLAGRLLADMDAGGDRWDVVSLPALAQDNDPLGRPLGQPLWPEWEDLEGLERKRRAVGPRDWSALYQQSPSPDEGDYFKAGWLKTYDKAPDREILRVYGGSDYAVTSNGGDYTVHVVVGIDPDGNMYLLDLWRRQASSEEWVEAFCDLVKKWKPIGWAEEKGQINAGVGPFLDRRQSERKAWCARDQFPTRGDKAVRAQSIRGRMALEGLYCPFNAAWFPEFRRELLSFPAAKHDDQVDAMGLVGQLLDKMLVGLAARGPAKRKVDTGYAQYKAAPRLDSWVAN